MSTLSTASAPTTASAEEPASTKTKRVHALLELLSSERAFASDLALVRQLYIPAARGHSLPPPPPTPPASLKTRDRIWIPLAAASPPCPQLVGISPKYNLDSKSTSFPWLLLVVYIFHLGPSTSQVHTLRK